MEIYKNADYQYKFTGTCYHVLNDVGYTFNEVVLVYFKSNTPNKKHTNLKLKCDNLFKLELP